MKITAKSRYALSAMLGIALSKKRIDRLTLAATMGIPTDYVDHILRLLREKKIIKSFNGRYGGFQLLKSADKISIWDIFSAAETSLYPIENMYSTKSDDHLVCLERAIWSDVYKSFEPKLKAMWLSEAVAKIIDKNQINEFKISQCKAPSRLESRKNKKTTNIPQHKQQSTKLTCPNDLKNLDENKENMSLDKDSCFGTCCQ